MLDSIPEAEKQATHFKSAAAGVFYFLIVFALGFVLGVLRVLWGVPTLGEIGATVVEVPVMLLVSWFVCRRLIGHFEIEPRIGQGVLMGSVAFGLLMLAELLLALELEMTFIEYLTGYTGTAKLIGLLGQLSFGSFPIIQMAGSRLRT